MPEGVAAAMAGAEGGYLCLPTWRRAGKRFRQGRGVPPPVVYLVVGESGYLCLPTWRRAGKRPF